MIKTTRPVRLNPSEHMIDAEVYMEAHSMKRNDNAQTPTVTYTISSYIIGESGNLEAYETKTAIYRLSTWLALFGAYTTDQLEELHDDLFIAQVLFVNSKEWTGEEVQYMRFWDLVEGELVKV